MANPERLTNEQVQELAASVEAHIGPRKKPSRAKVLYTRR
jgi:hypothetical protein